MIKLFCYNKKIQLFFTGLLGSAAFAPFYLFPILLFAVPFLLERIVCSKSKKLAFFNSFLFGLGYFVGGLYWMSISLFIDIKSFWWLLPFSLTIIPAYCAIFIGLTGLFTYIFSKINSNRYLIVLIFSILWTIFEWLRGILFTGLPWNIIVGSFAFSNILLQPISILNCYGYGFFVILFYCSFFIYKEKLFLLNVLFFAILFSFSIFRVVNSEINYLDLNIRMIQPNIKQNLKWESELEKKNFEKLIDLSLSNGYEKIDIFIWPESAIPYTYFTDGRSNEIFSIINNKLLQNKKKLMTGVVKYDVASKKIYNSLIVVDGEKIIDFYDKYFLVPFGEFIPFRKFLPFVDKITGGSLDFSRGYKNKTVKLDNLLISPNICYESVFYNSINPNADIIVNITNDAWFGNSSGPYQHFDNLKFRAIENNISAIRVANSGISGVINPLGEVDINTKLNEENVLDVKISVLKNFNFVKIEENNTIIFLFLVTTVLFIFNFFKRSFIFKKCN